MSPRTGALERVSAEAAVLSSALDTIEAVVCRKDLDQQLMAGLVKRVIATARRRVAQQEVGRPASR